MSEIGSPKTPEHDNTAARDEDGNLLRPGIGVPGFNSETQTSTPFLDGNARESEDEESNSDNLVTVTMLGEVQDTLQTVLLVLAKAQSDNESLRNEVRVLNNKIGKIETENIIFDRYQPYNNNNIINNNSAINNSDINNNNIYGNSVDMATGVMSAEIPLLREAVFRPAGVSTIPVPTLPGAMAPPASVYTSRVPPATPMGNRPAAIDTTTSTQTTTETVQVNGKIKTTVVLTTLPDVIICDRESRPKDIPGF